MRNMRNIKCYILAQKYIRYKRHEYLVEALSYIGTENCFRVTIRIQSCLEFSPVHTRQIHYLLQV